MEPEIIHPIVHRTAIIEQFPYSNGWRFIRIPEAKQPRDTPFGYLGVCGSIDDYEIFSAKLMPIGNGQLFLPVKAAIRKHLNKDTGDKVKILLYPDTKPVEVDPEILVCLKLMDGAWEAFNNLPVSKQRIHIEYINQAPSDKSRIKRINSMLSDLIKNPTASSIVPGF